MNEREKQRENALRAACDVKTDAVGHVGYGDAYVALVMSNRRFDGQFTEAICFLEDRAMMIRGDYAYHGELMDEAGE